MKRPSPSSVRIGIVTVTFNSAGVLPDFLRSVREQRDVAITLYAVDNASTDDTRLLLEGWDAGAAELVLIRSEQNLGVAEGNNLGIARAVADGVDWVLLLNNDTEFAPGTVRGLVDAAQASGSSVVSPVIEGDDPPGSLWYGGGEMKPWQGYRTVHTDAGATSALDRSVAGEVEATGYAPTCCLLVAPGVFAAAGMMDASYFVYFDDVDFCIRVQRAGFTYALTSRARLLHKAGSITGTERGAFSARWGVRNWVLTARRHALSRTQLVASLIYIQLHIIGGSLRARDPWWRFVMRQRAYREGLRWPLEDHTLPRV